MRVIGEAQQEWAPLRRKYNLFTHHPSPNPKTDMGSKKVPLSESDLSQVQKMQLTQASGQGQGEGTFNQFAYVDEPFLSWDFSLLSAENRLIGSVNRNFAGFAREIFTDTGVYALRMDSAGLGGSEAAPGPVSPVTAMTLDQRAVMLATAVSIDFDYFSRHSHAGGMGFMPLWLPGAGGEAAAGGVAGSAAGGAAAGEAGAVGVGEAAAGTLGRAGAAGGMADGVAAGTAGAGAMAGYEAMQRGMSGSQSAQGDASPQQADPSMDQKPPEHPGFYEDVWPEERPQDAWGAEEQDPWDAGESGGEDGGDDWF